MMSDSSPAIVVPCTNENLCWAMVYECFWKKRYCAIFSSYVTEHKFVIPDAFSRMYTMYMNDF